MPRVRRAYQRGGTACSAQARKMAADRRHILFQVVSWLPPVLLALMSALYFAFFAAPFVVGNGLLGSVQLNIYDAYGNMLLGNVSLSELSIGLDLMIVALLFFASLGLLFGIIAICCQLNGRVGKFLTVVEFFIYTSLLIFSVEMIISVKKSDNEFSGGLGVITAGSCPTLIIVLLRQIESPQTAVSGLSALRNALYSHYVPFGMTGRK